MLISISISIVKKPDCLVGITSVEQLQQALKVMDKIDREEIARFVQAVNVEHYAHLVHSRNPVLLYHGSDKELTKFELTTGRRSGFMGSEYAVTNLGIFLSDSKGVAAFYGDNRSKYGRGLTHHVYANLDNLLDISDLKSLPKALRTIGLKLVNAHYGTKKSALAIADVWWLLDRLEFVQAIKTAGYNSIKFKETPAIQREIAKTYKVETQYTFMVFDPKDLAIVCKANDLISTLPSLITYIKSR
jgi:hypothetical protein